MNSGEKFASFYARERRYRRFALHIPVRLSFPLNGRLQNIETVSENVSVGGLLVKAAARIPLRTPVSLKLDVRTPRTRRAIWLSGEGEVVRVEEQKLEAKFSIAIECKRPITEMKNRLSAAS